MNLCVLFCSPGVNNYISNFRSMFLSRFPSELDLGIIHALRNGGRPLSDESIETKNSFRSTLQSLRFGLQKSI